MSKMMERGSIKLTVLYEDSFWVGVFEKYTSEGYSVAKHIFGDEPSSPEVHDFVLKNIEPSQFTTPQKEAPVVLKKRSPKKLQRDVKKEMKRQGKRTVSKAHEAIKQELKVNKNERKLQTRAEREEEAERKFLLKQEKRKQKHKGR